MNLIKNIKKQNSKYYNFSIFFITFTGIYAALGYIMLFFNVSIFPTTSYLKLDLSEITIVIPFLFFNSNKIAFFSSISIGLIKNLLYMLSNFASGGLAGHLIQIGVSLLISTSIFFLLYIKFFNFSPYNENKNKWKYIIFNTIATFIVVILVTGIAVFLDYLIIFPIYFGPTHSYSEFKVAVPFLFLFNIIKISIIFFVLLFLSQFNFKKAFKINRF